MAKRKKSFEEQFNKALEEVGYEKTERGIFPIWDRDRTAEQAPSSMEHHVSCPSCEGTLLKSAGMATCQSCGYKEAA